MHKQYTIFDMDGTLVNSMRFWQRLGQEYLESKGITENLDSILERIKPMTMSESAKLFVEEFSLEGTPISVAAEMNAIMEQHYYTDIPLKQGAKEYIEKLYREGVKMCVASAASEDLMKACFSRLGIARYFEFLLSCEAVGVGKSQPDIYYEAARCFDVLPKEIAVYEDAFYAAKTAKAAGFYTIGVYDKSNQNNWEEMKQVADEYIVNWNEYLKKESL